MPIPLAVENDKDWCFDVIVLKAIPKIEDLHFFHIPSHGTEVNEVRERSPFLNMICFLVCKLFRMPMPAGYRGILVREFPCSKLKKKKKYKRSRPQGHFCLETLPWTWCFTIIIHWLTKNDFLSTKNRNVTQTSRGLLLVAKLVQSKKQSTGRWLWFSCQSLYVTVWTGSYFSPWCRERGWPLPHCRGWESIPYTQRWCQL